MTMRITFCKTYKEAEDALLVGAIPIECSFGSDGSVVDLTFMMDHHGEYSHLEGVAIRAYRDHFGALRETFRTGEAHFAVTGAADADACWAIASLIGVLPHPSRAAELEKAPPPVRESGTRDLMEMASLINQMDTAPIGLRLEESQEGCRILLWEQLASGSQDASAFHAGVDRWRSILAREPLALLGAVKDEEARRVTKARAAQVEQIGPEVFLVQSEVWGFDVWYAERGPIIVAHTRSGNVTVGVRDQETAERLFGPGGLKAVFSMLTPSGWGGREAIGGSPRGLVITPEQAREAALVVQSAVKPA